MSRPVYNGIKWDQTSGDLKLLFHGDENNKIYTELGISESEYLKVTYNIGLQPSFGNDDYKADLDADNIVNLYNNSSKDYLTVVNTYYNDIESGALNRADEFIKNNKLDYIQNEILQASSYISETTSSFDPYGYPVVEFITPNMDELKNLNPVGYNFIKSLENHENNLVDYINN